MDPNKILKKLLSFDRQNFDDVRKISDTSPALDYVAELLRENNIAVNFQEYERCIMVDWKRVSKERKNLVARLHDRTDLPIVGFEGHIDTVPFADYKDFPLGKEDETKIYGRGAVDMTGSVAGMIAAFIDLKNERSPAANVELIITSDEEARKFEGIKRYLRDGPKLDFAICGEPTSMIVKDKFKGALYYKLSVIGKSGHGSRPYEGENAIIKGAGIISALSELYTEIPTITDNKFLSEDVHSHESTMNFGVINGGTKVNMIPNFLNIEFEMRLVKPKEEYIEYIDAILKKYDKHIANFEQVFAENPVIVKIEPKHFFYDRINRLSDKRLVGVGFSEANYLNPAGIPTIQFGVGNESLCHTNEEYVLKEDLIAYKNKLIDFIR